jgi:hypothetical protein
LASTFWTSKTTWVALAAIGMALVDAAAKGALSWQQGLVILVAMLGATIRDTLAKNGEDALLQEDACSRMVLMAAGAATTAESMAEAMAVLLRASKQNAEVIPPSSAHFLVAEEPVRSEVATEEEMDGEADREEALP